MTHPLETIARQTEWAGKNTAHNLGFLPEDKLGWKPAPTAKSALEIVNHVGGFTLGMVHVAREGAWTDPDFQPATNLKEAQELIERAATEYAAALREVNPSRLGESITLPFGTYPAYQVFSMPQVDLIHHHGQIAYLQTLLGDEEMHFTE